MDTVLDRQKKLPKAIIGLAAFYFAFTAAGETITYDTTQYWATNGNQLAGLGALQTTTVGNTFIAPTGWSVTLNDFSFYGHGNNANSTANLHLRAFVFAWSGDLVGYGGGAVGSPVYFGPSFLFTAPPSLTNWWPLEANIGQGGVKLFPGQTYVMGFTMSAPADYAASSGNIGFQEVPVRNPYSPWNIPSSVEFGSGGAVWLNAGTNFDALNTTVWDTWGDTGVMGFKAHFTVLTAPPPPQIVCPEPLALKCDQGSAVGTLTAQVIDTNGFPVTVVWMADGIPVQTNDLPSGGTLTAANVTFTATFGDGEHTIAISASNGQSPPVTCSTAVTVSDTLPPNVSSISVSPNVLWPPNHAMVPITVNVTATDQCDASPTAAISQITCNEPTGRFERDWIITGPLSAELRAERTGKTDRVYTIYIEVTDASGNKTTATVSVTVPNSRQNAPGRSRPIVTHHREMR
jgi:hypothetical protein